MVLLDTETPGTSREIYSEDAEGETCLDYNPGVVSLNHCTSQIGSQSQLRNDKYIL